MSRIRRYFADTDIGQLHYRRIDGPDDSPHRPVLCLHQSPRSSREFAPFMERMGSDRTVIAIDTPGHGESALPPENPPVTIQDYARLIWQAVGSLDLGPIDIFGNHTGAKVAIEMAHQQPASVRHIIMISALVLSPEEQKEFEDMFQPIPLDDEGSRFKHMWETAQKYRSPGMSLEMLAENMAEGLRAGEAYEWGHAAAFAYNAYFPDVVQSLPHRITVFNPADLLFDLTPRVAPLLQNGEIIDRLDWAHGALGVHTKSIVDAVREVLSP